MRIPCLLLLVACGGRRAVPDDDDGPTPVPILPADTGGAASTTTTATTAGCTATTRWLTVGELTDVVLRRLLRASTASPNVLGQRRLLPLLQSDLDDLRAGRPPAIVGATIAAMRERRDALVAVLERHGMPPAGRPPEGTIFLMARLPPWWEGDDDVAFAERAIEAADLTA